MVVAAAFYNSFSCITRAPCLQNPFCDGLDQGVNDNGFLRNAAGRLIVYGFAHGIYPGFPGSREFEWEYALSGLEALNPDNF